MSSLIVNSLGTNVAKMYNDVSSYGTPSNANNLMQFTIADLYYNVTVSSTTPVYLNFNKIIPLANSGSFMTMSSRDGVNGPEFTKSGTYFIHAKVLATGDSTSAPYLNLMYTRTGGTSYVLSDMAPAGITYSASNKNFIQCSGFLTIPSVGSGTLDLSPTTEDSIEVAIRTSLGAGTITVASADGDSLAERHKNFVLTVVRISD